MIPDVTFRAHPEGRGPEREREPLGWIPRGLAARHLEEHGPARGADAQEFDDVIFRIRGREVLQRDEAADKIEGAGREEGEVGPGVVEVADVSALPVVV